MRGHCMKGVHDRQAASHWPLRDPHLGGKPTMGRAMEPSCCTALQANQHPGTVRSAVGANFVRDQLQQERHYLRLSAPDHGVVQPLWPPVPFRWLRWAQRWAVARPMRRSSMAPLPNKSVRKASGGRSLQRSIRPQQIGRIPTGAEVCPTCVRPQRARNSDLSAVVDVTQASARGTYS